MRPYWQLRPGTAALLALCTGLQAALHVEGRAPNRPTLPCASMCAGMDLKASSLMSFVPWVVMALGSTTAGLLADGLVSRRCPGLGWAGPGRGGPG